MKFAAMLFTVFAFALSAQDNAQQISCGRAGVTFQVISPDVGRGPDGYAVLRYWSGDAFGIPASLQSQNTSIPIQSGNTDYDNFVTLNNAAVNPVALQVIAASFSANLKQSGGSIIVPAPLSVTYTPAAGFIGDDTQLVTFTNGGASYATTTITFHVANTPPTTAAQASPSLAEPGDVVALSANAADVDGQALTYAWDFGDGSTSTDANPPHTYAAAGLYTASVTVSDGFAAVVSSVVVDVAGTDRIPEADFTTSDVSAFATVPFVFDASFSTDPQNSPLRYAWDFGDGSPIGSGNLIAKKYASEGTFVVTLTVTNAQGLSNSITRSLEVLPADAVGTFDAAIDYTATFNGLKPTRDKVVFKAHLNIGKADLLQNPGVALQVAGKRFEAQLDKHLRRSASGATWSVKTKLRHQTPGTVDIKATLRAVGLFTAFAQAGADDDTTLDIPLHIEVGGKSFDVPVSTDFQITGQRGRADGSL